MGITKNLFEYTNHLGNVLATISDKKVQHTTDNTTVDYYLADVVTANDYYPFGMGMSGRKYTNGSKYRYGFNGKENDNEVKGEGNQQDYGARIYDPRLGRFLSKDPLTGKYAGWTPYAFAMNDVIRCIDLDGAEKKVVVHWIDGFYGDGTPKITKTTVDINKNIVFINTSSATGLPLNDGKKYAGTEVYYALPDGRFLQGQTLYEEIVPGGMKPSANYDYTKNVMPDKNADDAAYASSRYDAAYAESEASGTGGSWGAGAGAWVKAYVGITGRDMNAPDNAMTIESMSGLNAAAIVVAHVNMKGGWVGESNAGWSTFSKNYQKQISGREGEAYLLNGVKFDGLAANGKTLLEAKGKYEFLLSKGWAQEGLLKQARSQITAAKGTAIEWHFAEEGAANAVKSLFEKNGIKGIDVHFTPSIKTP